MGLPALLIPEPWPAAEFSEVHAVEYERLRTELRLLLDDARRKPPAEGTPAENEVLLRLATLGLEASRLVGESFVALLRANLNHALQDLIQRELAAAEPERKLALRHIEHAVHRYGVLMESLTALFQGLSPSTFVMALEEMAEQVRLGVNGVTLSEPERLVPRFQFDVMVALDVLDGSLDELTFWSFRAITGARRVEAMAEAVAPSGVRGELARIRSRRAWLDWDEAELAEELAPWPNSPR